MRFPYNSLEKKYDSDSQRPLFGGDFLGQILAADSLPGAFVHSRMRLAIRSSQTGTVQMGTLRESLKSPEKAATKGEKGREKLDPSGKTGDLPTLWKTCVSLAHWNSKYPFTMDHSHQNFTDRLKNIGDFLDVGNFYRCRLQIPQNFGSVTRANLPTRVLIYVCWTMPRLPSEWPTYKSKGFFGALVIFTVADFKFWPICLVNISVGMVPICEPSSLLGKSKTKRS